MDSVRSNLPAGLLWPLRAFAIAGLALTFLGPARMRAYGPPVWLVAAGIGALGMHVSTMFGRVLTLIAGLALLGLACVLFWVKCVPR